MGTQLPQKGGTAPNFQPMCIVAKWSPISATAEQLLFSDNKLLITFFINVPDN